MKITHKTMLDFDCYHCFHRSRFPTWPIELGGIPCLLFVEAGSFCPIKATLLGSYAVFLGWLIPIDLEDLY